MEEQYKDQCHLLECVILNIPFFQENKKLEFCKLLIYHLFHMKMSNYQELQIFGYFAISCRLFPKITELNDDFILMKTKLVTGYQCSIYSNYLIYLRGFLIHFDLEMALDLI